MGTKLFEVITEEELIEVVKHTKKVKHKLAFMLGFYECMRISEILKLTPGDIDFTLKLIKIKQSKGHKDRNIPIAPQVLRGLKHIPIGITVNGLQKSWNKETKKTLGKRLNFHLLRHSGITWYLTKKKWNTMEVQRLAGHSKSTITEIYTHINPQNLVDRMWE